jgi:vacuolar protein sorting-associated protein 72
MSAYQLPERATRGKRLRAALEDEEQNADEEFWNQEFFAEEAKDEDYKSEREEEDVVDSDFDESESEEDEGDVEALPKSPRRKTLKPPGAPPSRPKPLKPAGPKPEPKPRLLTPSDALTDLSYEAPTLRESTRQRMLEAQKLRELQKEAKPVRKQQKVGEGWKIMTQEEMLAEAARTELENMASLKLLLALEEETKKRAAVVKKGLTGPLVKYRSRAVQQLQQPAQQQQQQFTHPPQQQQQQGETSRASQPLHPIKAPGAEEPPPAAACPGSLAAPPEQSEAAKAKSPPPVAPPAAAAATEPQIVKVEVSTLQCLNMKAPPLWLRPQRPSAPPRQPRCSITGRPARYCDPATGQYYADSAAFAEIRRRMGLPLPAARPPPPAPIAATAGGVDNSTPAAQVIAAAAAGGGFGHRGGRRGGGGGRGGGRLPVGSGLGGDVGGNLSVQELPDEVVGLLLDVCQQFMVPRDSVAVQPVGVR